MQEDNQRTRQNNTKQSSINKWKWAFIALVALMIGVFIYLTVAIQPVTINEPNLEPISETDGEIELSAQMNKEDTERLMNTYLNTTVGEDFDHYQIALTDQLEFHGNIGVFGFSIPFSLYFDPFVQENGNIQLRGESVDLASFSLPVSTVMSLVASQVDFPAFIAMDSDEQVIFINLNELTEDFNVSIEMTKIDLEADELELNLRLDESTMTNQLQLEAATE